MVEFYTDGACSGNPGPGGWAMIGIENKDIIYSEASKEDDTTNNRMEMKAMQAALDTIRYHQLQDSVIYSDSAYVVNMCNSWIWNWEKHNWQNSKGKTVENIDLVQDLYITLNDLMWSDIKYSIVKIPGHSGMIGNEIVDALATGNEKKYFKFYEKLTN